PSAAFCTTAPCVRPLPSAPAMVASALPAASASPKVAAMTWGMFALLSTSEDLASPDAAHYLRIHARDPAAAPGSTLSHHLRRGLGIVDLGDLVELPLLGVLATYRRDGSVLLSPVWHEWRDGGFNVVTTSRGVKARHLRRDSRAGLVVCEPSPPYRGVE